MSNVNYDLKKRGVRMISSEEAWVKTKSGGVKLNPMYRFVGKVDIQMPNIDCNSFGQNCFSGCSKGYGTDPNGLVNIRLFGNIILTMF